MGLNRAISFVIFVAVGTGSPGPNNTLLLASGIAFGFRRTVPHVLGTSLGMALLVGTAAISEGLLVTVLPDVQVALKVVASAYLVYLAIRLGGGVAVDRAAVQKPFSVARAAVFQFVNPKAWVFSLALVSVYAPSSGPVTTVGIVIPVVAIVVVATAAPSAFGGTMLRRALATERARRIAGLVLGVLLVASVAFLWL